MRFTIGKTSVDVKYKKISTPNIVPRPEIRMRTSEGKLVQAKRVADNGQMFEGFHWKHFDEEGREVSVKDICYFQVKEDGTEVEVRPFDRTKEIRIVKEIPATSNDFLVESTYELYHTDEGITQVLYEEAQRYWKEDLMGIALFSWGKGFKQYYALLQPIPREGGFVWVMMLTQCRMEYNNLMPIPAEKIPEKKVPTVALLPPIE